MSECVSQVADLRSKEISYFDSMGGDNLTCLETIESYLVSEMQDKKNQTLDVSQWKLTNKEANVSGDTCEMLREEMVL